MTMCYIVFKFNQLPLSYLLTVQQCNVDMYRNIMKHLSVNNITKKEFHYVLLNTHCCELV
jgi:hypothetical protein